MELLQQGARQLGFLLTEPQLEMFRLYYEELIAWNRRINLTAITDLAEVQVKHFLDSLTCLLAFPSEAVSLAAGPEGWSPPAESPKWRVIDIGSGGGFPGLPLKIFRPELEVTLVDSVAKKTAFLHHLVARLRLSDVSIITARAEEIGHRPEQREQYDIALSRAVTILPTLLEYCLPLTRVGGRFIAPKKMGITAELKAAARALTLLGGRLREPVVFELPIIAEQRQLVVVDKVQSTPRSYPRRPGIPAKRPL
ncbi:MAG: 16S rRNA (guanine(527)-N(7))-methyltransferase RsmG [Chloroflexi bacterium]|nr:16S rRNA (guanine(527)-N(7))-methyltransferase RsmG [Chloroflexota bacterium]MCL5074530.1 16S rRNA (guanine(527)-N(7))-methyltransferase RsmG [Chloroflexota bacterium]